MDYLFYFPRGGHFAHFPAHVAKNKTLVAAAKPTVFEVAETPSKPDAKSWEYVSPVSRHRRRARRSKGPATCRRLVGTIGRRC